MPKFRNIPSSSSKKNLHAPLFEEQTLLTTNQIIDLARKAGVDFGPGDPAERIRYFIKLGILPHMVRKIPDKTSDFRLQTSDLPATPVGHLAYSSTKKLIDVDRLYKKGYSYPQIAQKLSSEEEVKAEQEEARQSPQKANPIKDTKPRIIYVQKIGNKDIKDTLKQHELKLEKLVRDELTHSLSLGKTESDVQETSTLKDQLIPTQEIIAKAKTAGVSFGNGNPYERIRHLIKLEILPHATRKTVKDPISGLEKTVGHLPEWSVKRLVYINKLHQEGLNFEQIAQKIRRLEKTKLARLSAKEPIALPSISSQTDTQAKPSINFFPKIGVSEKYIDRKLEEYQANFHKILDYKLAQVPLDIGTTLLDFKPKNKLWVYARGFAVTTSLTILLSIGIISGRNYFIGDQDENIQQDQNISSNLLGQVLAASSDDHRLYIDADTQVSGTTLFAENITAPNVLYGAVAGTGITVSTGQTPAIGLDTTAVVTAVNDLAGTLTITGSGSTSISASGSTINISSTDNNAGGDITAVSAGNGLTGGGTSGDISLAVALTSSGTTSTTSSASGLQFSSGLSLLRGCSNSQTLAWVSTTSTWDCGGGFTGLTLAGDSGISQTISDGDTITVAGGTNGIDTVAGATDTITINFDSTEVGTTTWGSGSSIAWTFNAGATDPVLTFDSNALTIGSAATITATAVTAFNCTDCLDFDDLENTLDLDENTEINLSTLNLTFDLDSSGVLQIQDASTNYWVFDDDSTVDVTFPAAGQLAVDASTTASTLTTVGVIDLNITSNTNNNRGIDWAYTFGAGINSRGYGLYGAYTTSGTSVNYNYGIYHLLTHDVSGAKFNYGIYSDMDISTTSATNSYAGYFNVNSDAAAASNTFSLYGANVHSGAISGGTKNVYGIYANGDADSTASGGTSNAYGGYFVGDGDTDGTGTAYGIYTTASGGDTNYGLYSAAGKAAFILGASDKVFIDASTTTNTSITGVLDINVTTLEDNARGIDLNFTWNNNELTSSGYGIFTTITRANSNLNNLYGNYIDFNDAISDQGYNYGLVADINTTGDTAGWKLAYGIYSDVTNDNTTTAQGIRATHGGYFKATGSTRGTTFAYSVFAAGAFGADTGFGVYVGNGTSTTNYGIYLVDQTGGTSDFGLTIAGADTQALWISSDANTTDAANGIAFGSSRDTNLYRSGTNALRTDDTFQVSDGSDYVYIYTSIAGTPRITFRDDASTTRFCWDNYSGTQRLFSATSDDCSSGGSVILAISTTNFQIDLDDTTTFTQRLCHSGSDGATGFVDIGDCAASGQADIAEYYGSDGSLEAGEIVIATGEALETVGIDEVGTVNKAFVKKSNATYQSEIIGIVSTNPSPEILSDGVFEPEANPLPIALAGRVPVKVSLENGPIEVGDYITSSSIAGVGMRASKAGRVVGMALQSFDCSSEIIDHSLELDNSQNSTNYELPTQHSNCQGQIVVFVNPTFYLGTNLASNGSLSSQLSTSEVEDSYTSEVLLSGDQINSDGTVNCQLSEASCDLDGQILTAPQVLSLVEGQVQRLVEDEVTKQLASSPIPDRNSSSANEASDSAKPPEATDSAGLAQQTQQTLDELDSLLSTSNLQLDTLAVTGNTNLAQTQVAGTFSQDGTLIIDYGKQINVLGSTLYLQNDPLAGCSAFSDPVSKNSNETGSSCASGILVNIGTGKVTIDNQGNLVTSGKLTASSVQTKKLVVYTDEGSAKTVGTSSISSGSSSRKILTAALEPSAKILITPRTPTGGKTIYISESVDFESFTVSLENGPATGEIRFDWLIVNTASNTSEVENSYTSEVD